MTEHLPPQNVEMEAAVLGCMLIDNRAARHCIEALDTEDFYRPQHQKIFAAAKHLLETGKALDEQLVGDELKRRGELKEVGGVVGLMTLTERVPAIANHKAYADAVRVASVRHSLVKAGHAIAAAGYECEDTTALLADVERTAHDARVRIDRVKGAGDGVWLESMLDDWNYFRGEDTDRVQFPLNALNTIAGGQAKGNIVVTGGYSSDGKSWFGLECAEAAALQGARTLVLSLEMPRDEVYARLVAMGGHNFDNVLRRSTPAAQINDRIGKLRALPLKVLDATNGVRTLGRLRMELSRARVDGKPFRYVLADHLHLMEVDGGKDGYRLALNQMLAEAKSLAVEFGVTLHFLAQLRRPAGDAAFPIPKMTDFRESSGVENIADYGLMVWRERDQDGAQLANGLVVTAKVRSGKSIGAVPVRFDEKTCRFVRRLESVKGGVV